MPGFRQLIHCSILNLKNMSKSTLRTFLIVVLVLQAVLICCGVWQLTQGKIGNGLFNIILNLVFGYVNYSNLKKVDKL